MLKTHLKDRQLRMSRDRRKPDYRIDAVCDWATLDHVYTVARSGYAGATMDVSAMTTCVAIPTGQAEGASGFDYADSYDLQAVMVKLGETVLLAVLNDGCVSTWYVGDILRESRFPLSPPAVTELFARVVHQNNLVANRPSYGSSIDVDTAEYIIRAKVPLRVEAHDWSDEEFGKIIYFYPIEAIEAIPDAQRDHARKSVLSGRATYLGRVDGNDEQSGA